MLDFTGDAFQYIHTCHLAEMQMGHKTACVHLINPCMIIFVQIFVAQYYTNVFALVFICQRNSNDQFCIFSAPVSDLPVMHDNKFFSVKIFILEIYLRFIQK